MIEVEEPEESSVNNHVYFPENYAVIVQHIKM